MGARVQPLGDRRPRDGRPAGLLAQRLMAAATLYA